MSALTSVTKEEKLEQLERLLQCRALQGSETLRAFLRFVSLKAIEGQEHELKEYVIATEVFRRGGDYDSRVDSVVRVQAGRLRTKLQEYYSDEGRHDRVVIELPKGNYTPVFSYSPSAMAANGVKANGEQAAAAGSTNDVATDAAAERESQWQLKTVAYGLAALTLIFGTLAFKYRAELTGKQSVSVTAAPAASALEAVDRQAVAPLWGELWRSPEPILIVFSNTLFQGTTEKGMKLLKSLDAPAGSPGSPVLAQQMVAEAGDVPLVDHYTGIGEVVGMHFLADFFARAGHASRVKRSLLLNWDDTKTENIVVLGSPAENFFLRDLPNKQDFIFRTLKDERQQQTFGIINTKPQAGEQRVYVAKQEGRSRSQITEDYAVVSLLQGLSEKNRLLILAGITTYGTQAAAEYVTNPQYIKDLIQRLNIAPAGEPPRLPANYQVLLRVKVNGGVPIQISYVTHHVL